MEGLQLVLKLEDLGATKFSTVEALCLGQAERQDMASWEEFHGRLLLTLYRSRHMGDENPWI